MAPSGDFLLLFFPHIEFNLGKIEVIHGEPQALRDLLKWENVKNSEDF